jgi:hypothetical protein
MPRETGLVVAGDAKALAMVDLDGDGRPDFVVTRNNGATLAFGNHTRHGRGLAVQLRGQPGNPDAVGARVTLEYANGAKTTTEVYAGSGYYTQSSARCWFSYTESNPAKNIVVRWPDGSTATQPVPTGQTRVVVTR